MTNCTEALRLLRRLTADEAMSYPVDHGNPPDTPTVGNELHCDYCDANIDHDGPHKDDCPWAEARAFLADPPSCDAEKAVLVAAITRIRDKAHEYGALPAEIERLADEELRAVGTSPAAAVLLAQGERMKVARGKVMMIDASPAGGLNAQLKTEALAALAPGEEKE